MQEGKMLWKRWDRWMFFEGTSISLPVLCTNVSTTWPLLTYLTIHLQCKKSLYFLMKILMLVLIHHCSQFYSVFLTLGMPCQSDLNSAKTFLSLESELCAHALFTEQWLAYFYSQAFNLAVYLKHFQEIMTKRVSALRLPEYI